MVGREGGTGRKDGGARARWCGRRRDVADTCAAVGSTHQSVVRGDDGLGVGRDAVAMSGTRGRARKSDGDGTALIMAW